MRRFLVPLAVFVCAWWAGLHAFASAAAVASCGLLFALVRLGPRREGLLAAALAGPCLVAFVAEWPSAQEALVVRARAGTWNDAERASVYVLHLAMAGGGLLAGYPEVALEAARLHVPAGDLALSSDFPLRSERFREAVGDGLRAHPEGAFEVRVAWPHHAGDDARVSLALNPADVRCEPAPSAVSCVTRVAVDYGFLERPTPLVPGVFAVYDALFASLQRDGWLFPYTATWRSRWTPEEVSVDRHVRSNVRFAEACAPECPLSPPEGS